MNDNDRFLSAETKSGFTVLCTFIVIIMRSKRSDTSSGKIKGFSGSVLWTEFMQFHSDAHLI